MYNSLFSAHTSVHLDFTRSAKEATPGGRIRKVLCSGDASIIAPIASAMPSHKLIMNLALLGCRTSRDLFARSVPRYAAQNAGQRSQMATVAPPVTQSSMGSKGPTAMVFMNMGGPSTTDQVGDFLSRLFVSANVQCTPLKLIVVVPRQMVTSSHSVDCNHTSDL